MLALSIYLTDNPYSDMERACAIAAQHGLNRSLSYIVNTFHFDIWIMICLRTAITHNQVESVKLLMAAIRQIHKQHPRDRGIWLAELEVEYCLQLANKVGASQSIIDAIG
jgi:hypothetical protein